MAESSLDAVSPERLSEEPVAVTFVAAEAENGGSERYLEVLVSTLGAGWVGRILLLRHGPLEDRLRSLGHEVVVVPAHGRAGILPAAFKLRRLFSGGAPEVVHANGIKAALVTSLATIGMPTPIVWAKHDFSWDGPLARVVGRRSSQIVAQSSALTTIFHGELAERVYVIPAGIRLPETDRPCSRRRVTRLLGCGPDQLIVILVGRLQESKGQIELLEAVPEILALRPQVRFCFVGGGHPFQPEYGRALRARCQELGVESAVTFAGYRADAQELLAGCDVAVVPSMPDHRGRGREGGPLVAIEALALGVPVVGYTHGGIPEAVGDAGYLVSAGDREALRDAIVLVLEDDALRHGMVARGLERVARRNRPAEMAAAMRERYREAAG